MDTLEKGQSVKGSLYQSTGSNVGIRNCHSPSGIYCLVAGGWPGGSAILAASDTWR